MFFVPPLRGIGGICLKKVLDMADLVLQRIIIVTMGFMLFFTFAQVVARYALHSSLTYSEELSRYLFVWTVFLGLPVVARRGGHMAVLAVSSRLRGGAAKVCTSLAYAISIVFMTIMIVQGAGMVLRTFEQLSPAMEIPMAYVYLAIPAGCFFMLCQLLVDLYAFLTKGGDTA